MGQSWYCCDECKVTHKKHKHSKFKEDHILNYSKALAWRALGDMVRRDAERRNDGMAAIAFWHVEYREIVTLVYDFTITENKSIGKSTVMRR